ncbi:MAG TPA: phytoene desaturase family protein [Mycobacteriales bacterium]
MRVVVVGAGVGGLAVAARLAAHGHQVTVCEQAPVVGGKLGLVEKATPQGVFRFDTGPSMLTMPQVFEDLFADTGAPMSTMLDLVPIDPITRYRFADGTRLDSTADLEVFCARLDAALGPGTGADWRQFSQRAERIWQAVREPFTRSTVDGLGTLVRYGTRLGDARAVSPGRSLRWLAHRYLHDQRLRTFLDRYATYTGSDPRRVPAALAVVPYVEQTFGAWYVRRGMRTLADALLDRVTSLRATVRTGVEVTAVEMFGQRVSGVRLADGSRIPADVVVANADASEVYSDLVPQRRLARRVERAEPSLSAFVALLGVRGRTPNAAQHNVLFSPDHEAEFDAIFGVRAAPVADPTLFVSIPDDPAVRPDGYEAWFVLVNAPRHGQGPGAIDWDSPGLAQSYADRLLGVLARRGMPVADRLVFREILTPADLERRTWAPGGAIYGTSSNGIRSAFLRPANRSPVDGLFLVGGSSHPGGGLPMVALSAQIVANLIGPA